MVAQILPFARRTRPDEGRFRPGDRVVAIVDGEEVEGTVRDTGTEVGSDLGFGPIDGPQQHRVAVILDIPQMLDATTLRHL